MQQDGIVLDIHFPETRLNDMAGDPYWIDLTVEEAKRVFEALQSRFEAAPAVESPTTRLALTLD